MTQILILGGGAAGLLAAIRAKEVNPRAEVRILEAADRVGKKLLSTGNGRCNLTNVCAEAEDYAPAPAASVLRAHPPKEVMARFAGMGLVLKEEGEGRVYPASDAASSVLDTLRLTAAHLGVMETTGFAAEQVRLTRTGFTLLSCDGQKASGDKLIVACGGQAASKFTGYALVKAMGHTVKPLVPALLPLKTDISGLKGLNGVRVKCAATLMKGDVPLLREEGEVLFKDFGLSGIVIFQLSRALARQTGVCAVALDLLPELTQAQADEFLLARRELLGWRRTEEFFLGMLHKNIAANLFKACGIRAELVRDIPQEQLYALSRRMKHWTHAVTGTQGFAQAQVTVGGVPFDEVDCETLQSKKVPGLYLAGEILDVDGPCGGYNLQWAWASGLTAGENAAKE